MLFWISDLRDGGDEGRCCSSGMLDAGSEYLTSVKSLSMDLENPCYANGVIETDFSREC